MEIKTEKFIGDTIVTVILDEECHFFLPLNSICNCFGLGDIKTLPNITQRIYNGAFVEGVHYRKHKKGDLQCFKNLKPGSCFLSRAGLIQLCNMIHTEESKLIKEWATKYTYNVLMYNSVSRVNKMFRSILTDVCSITSRDLRKRLIEKLKELEKILDK